MAEHKSDALSTDSLFGHVKDADYFHVPRVLDFADGDGYLVLPQPVKFAEPIVLQPTRIAALNKMIEPIDGRLTKFMVLEFVAALLIAVIFISLARKIRGGGRPVGRTWNFLEAFLIFLRDEVARPAIGKHDADRFLPFIWTLFFFVLGCNLLGMVPWMGSPTGALAVTAMLAIITFAVVVGAGMAKMGPVGFWTGQVPEMDLPFVLAIFLVPLIFVLEVGGLLIKHFVLAVRLLANMFAGHIVLAVIVAFISAAWMSPMIWGIAPASVLGATALSLLELFVAFLQAYIFAFLAALFIGMAVHPH